MTCSGPHNRELGCVHSGNWAALSSKTFLVMFTCLTCLTHTVRDDAVPHTAGRAAQRLQEVLSGPAAEDVSASTIHRLLGYRNGAVLKRLSSEDQAALSAEADAGAGAAATLERDLDLGSKCEFNLANPLPRGFYLVDEVSMMDTALAAALFNGLR